MRTTKKIAASALALLLPKNWAPQVADDAAAGSICTQLFSWSRAGTPWLSSPDRDLNSGVASSCCFWLYDSQSQDRFVEVDTLSNSMSERKIQSMKKSLERSTADHGYTRNRQRETHNVRCCDPIDADISREIQSFCAMYHRAPLAQLARKPAHGWFDKRRWDLLALQLSSRCLVYWYRINALGENRESWSNSGPNQDLQAQIRRKTRFYLNKTSNGSISIESEERLAQIILESLEKNESSWNVQVNNKLLYLQQQNNLLSKKLEGVLSLLWTTRFGVRFPKDHREPRKKRLQLTSPVENHCRRVSKSRYEGEAWLEITNYTCGWWISARQKLLLAKQIDHEQCHW